jgi:peptide/nickel transport system ATP-binding protein
MEYMLEVKDLRIYYKSTFGDYKSVDGVTFVYRNGIFGIAGESGCGKSTLVEGILRLTKPPGYIPTGEVLFHGIDLLKIPEEELRKIRWRKIAYVPQGAMNSLNPVIRIEEQMMDVALDHNNSLNKSELKDLISLLLKRVGLPTEVAKMYPHELSGGMKQRVIIAMALILKPELIVADEPTTGLDVVVQKGIIQLLKKLNKEYNTAIIFVSHDMAAHAHLSDRIAIMYAGKIVEIGDTIDIFEKPLHPYTKGLISAIPQIGKKVVKSIPGLAPSPLNWPSGCRFHPRCPYAMTLCRDVDPPLEEIRPGRYVACHLYSEES